MIIPTAASAILVAQQVNKACGGNNCGLTIDYGHQKMEATTASTACDLAEYAGVPVHKFDINDARQKKRSGPDVWHALDPGVGRISLHDVRARLPRLLQPGSVHLPRGSRPRHRAQPDQLRQPLAEGGSACSRIRSGSTGRAAGSGPDVLDVVSPVLVDKAARVRPAFVVGTDFGTNSVRTIVVSCEDGREAGEAVFNYPSGDHGVLLHPRDPHLARQNPADYIEGLRASVIGALAGASRHRVRAPPGDRHRRRHDGIDAAADRRRGAAARDGRRWRENLAAHAWLWKDHTGAAEAAAITDAARTHAPPCSLRSVAPTHRSGGGRRFGTA